VTADPAHAEVLRAIIPKSAPKTGEQYRHFKGGLYLILGTGLLESNLEPVVIYMSADLVTWVRTLKDFRGTMKTEAGKIRRFVREV
jgi:hypothetical protein